MIVIVLLSFGSGTTVGEITLELYSLLFQDEEDTNEAKIETLLEQVTYIVDKMKEQELLKQREHEEKKQQEWVQKFATQQHGP